MSDKKQANERGITSVASYLEAVRCREDDLKVSVKADNTVSEEDKPTMKFFYRGHASAEWQLIPSLFRTIPGVNCFETANGIRVSYFPEISYFQEEQYLIQESERIFPELFVSCKNDVSRMAVAQHHGIPTRLLDVSGNALVALYFATQKCIDEGKERDGRVFVFRASAHDYKMASTGGRIDTIRIGRYHSGEGPLERVDHPLLVFPPFETSRQKAQNGAFYLFQNKGDDVLHFREKYYRVVTVPSSAKEAIRQDLESMLNVHRGTLFPEMLESYADKLKEDAVQRIRAEIQV